MPPLANWVPKAHPCTDNLALQQLLMRTRELSLPRKGLIVKPTMMGKSESPSEWDEREAMLSLSGSPRRPFAP